jgi:hypothetical protein
VDVALTLVLAAIGVGLFGAWSYALWRGWRHASRDQTRAERRLAVSGFAVLALLPIGFAVPGVSDDVARIAIAIGVAAVLPVFLIIGVRDHRRRERRIRARRHGTSGGDE